MNETRVLRKSIQAAETRITGEGAQQISQQLTEQNIKKLLTCRQRTNPLRLRRGRPTAP